MDHRLIAHVDMDAFYASVEQRDNPQYRGKPVIVGGTGARGVVAAANYEVRRFGVRSAMPMRDALRRCPDAICVRPRMSVYRDVSHRIFDVFREFSPLVEGLSLDEAFIDLTKLSKSRSANELGMHLKQRIGKETSLTASVGIGPNKLVAKIASDLEKPDGLCIVSRRHVNEILDPLPVRTISGIGPQTGKRLAQLGIHTIEELRLALPDQLQPIFGRYAFRIQQRASGIDERPVVAHSVRKSISSEETFNQDTADRDALIVQLTILAESVATSLRRKELVAGVVSVKIRTAEFVTRTRQRALAPPGNDSGVVRRVARDLLDQWLAENPGTKLRLLGVGVADLHPARQLGLFQKAPEATELDQAMDHIRSRYGDSSIRRGKPNT
ncbi:MAG: DNA polymerase IV [Gammaproteobacteria bacterium]|nr:DNA polymerase IV [Gammaproteobacteria bacterium]MDH3766952.1 DNA polymerase IV [Gammaproteobacteria bacterium]